MAVATDAASSASVKGTSKTSLSLSNITVGSGTNRALILWLCFDFFGGSAPTSISATWDSGGTSQAMSLITSQQDGAGVEIISAYGLVAPTSGAKTLLVSWTNTAAGVEMFAESFTGVNQTGGVTTFANAVTLTGTKNSNVNENTSPLAVTNASGDMVIWGWCTDGSINSTSQTQVWVADNTTTDGGGARAAGTGASLSATANLSGNVGAPYGAIGFDIVAATGTGFTPKFRRTLSSLGTRVGSRQTHFNRRPSGLIVPAYAEAA